MASSSSSSSTSVTPKPEYDVFLSFHGVDTRGKITSHLYDALCRAEIETFIDDNLVRGEEISPSLLQAIEQSKISIIIFSKGYASSSWCLKELEKILECKNKYGQIVIPIFSEVDPSDVRRQKGDFGKAFSKLEERFKNESERWRTALGVAANLSGFDSKNYGNEALLVKKIVDDILEKLGRLYNDGSETSHTKNLVGLDSSIKEIENLLCSNHIVGIWGMGGIGKTTLASAVVKKISNQFEASWFIENFGEEPKTSKGLNKILQKHRVEVLGDLHSNIVSIFSRRRLNNKKVLIVFDGVTTDEKQTDFVNETFEYLYSESRIIITSRDRHVLNYCGVPMDGIYKLQKLCSNNALQLFSLHAFKENRPPGDYFGLSKRVVASCEGLPLALKVLGAFLFERTKKEWESALTNSENKGFKDIREVLKISYDGLSDEEKVVFLDIACFFKGYQRDHIEAILNADDFDSHICISVLIERSLLITKSFSTIGMHDLLQEMGKKIVQQESIHNLGKRSRLWNHEDIVKVLKNNEGTRAIRSIHFDMSKVSELPLNPKAFDNMQHLRFLEFYRSKHEKKVNESDSSTWGLISRFWKENSPISRFWKKNSPRGEKKVHGFEVLKSDFSELRYFCWDGYPAKSLPPNFNPKNLVALRMPNSKVKELWTGNQELVNLKHIDLCYSEHLCRMPDFSLTPNLESLILEGCTNLLNNFSSIRNLHKLVILNLRGCKVIFNLPISDHCKSLRKINLSNCSNLKTISYLPCAVEELYLDGTAIKELISMEHLSRLKKLNLTHCSRLERLSESVRELKSLKCLYLFGCSKLDRWPNDLENLTTLEQLILTDVELPTSVTNLINLKALFLTRCKMQKQSSIPLFHLSVFQTMILLRLDDCNIEVLPDNIGQLLSLKYLYIGQNNFKSLPVSIKDLSKLLVLDVSNCKRLKSLPELPPKTDTIRAHNCISLESLSVLPSSWSDWGAISRAFNCCNCSKLQLDMENESLKIETAIHEIDPLEAYGKYKRGAFIFYTGSDIPNWFTIQSINDLIEFPLNYKTIGFVLCAIVSLQDYQEFTFKPIGFSFFLGGECVLCGHFFGEYLEEIGVLQSDHVLLGFGYTSTFYYLRGLDLISKSRIELQLYGWLHLTHGS